MYFGPVFNVSTSDWFMLLTVQLSLCQTTIHHLEEAGLNDPCIISPLNIEQTAPSAGKKGSSCSSSDESDEESETESTGGAYTQRVGTNLLSSSSSSSSSLTQPKPPPVVSSNQEPYSQRNALISTGSPSRAGLELRSCGGRPKEEEEKDVNLLTLTFGRVEQEEEKEKKSDFIVEEVAFDSVLGEEGATETVHDEEEEVCGYMGRSGI